MRNRSHILNPTNPKTLTRQHSNRSLRTRTRSPSLMATRSPDTNMERSNPLILSHFGGGRCSLHRRVRSPLKTVSLDVLTTRAPRNRLGTSQIGNVNHRIIETGIDVRDAPAIYRLSLLRHDTNYPRGQCNQAREFKLLAIETIEERHETDILATRPQP
jgi:hypothetical protein